ncbi:MAG: hypothetical protein J7K72_05060 [Candidatus Aenigmarchaeota archaeon]|nr:hypothetical protein [Candidatus Aenigmarchaeota archaeon]
MEYERPTPENVINSMNLVLKKEYDARVRIKFFLSILRAVEEEPEMFKLMIIEKIDKLVNDL